MAGYINHDAFDAALNVIKNNVTHLYITDDTGAPDTFTKASSTYACGVKAGPTFTGPANHSSGRKITVDAIGDGSITANATAKYFALTDNTNSKLYVYQELASTQGVTSGNTFTLTAIIIAITDPA